jgi:hypothetical protein
VQEKTGYVKFLLQQNPKSSITENTDNLITTYWKCDEKGIFNEMKNVGIVTLVI